MSDISVPQPRGPEEHRKAAKLLGIKGNSAAKLIVLSSDNDPFYKGTPAHRRDAEWFTDVWDQSGYTSGVHTRRIHYRILSNSLTLPGGAPYENTESCWSRLCAASAAARILGMVDAEAFIDRRNASPLINRTARQVPLVAPRVGLGVATWRLPELDLDGLGDVEIEVGSPAAFGYDYDPADQPVMVELWIEKTTMADVLVPLCARERVNLVQGSGFESITQTVAFLRRAQEHGKPAHIIYVSDFDPGGEAMPVAVARQCQFWLDKLKIDVDVTVDHAVLTQDQCVEFELPRTPIKDSDLRRGGFEARYGTGATELDALEALHPGALADITRRAIAPFVDRGLSRRLYDARTEAQRRIDDAWTEAAGQELEEAARELSERASTAAARQAEFIRQIAEEALGELDEFADAAQELEQQGTRIAAGLNIELPPRPEPEIAGLDDARLLFDSRRHWVEQLAVFKQRQNGGAS